MWFHLYVCIFDERPQAISPLFQCSPISPHSKIAARPGTPPSNPTTLPNQVVSDSPEVQKLYESEMVTYPRTDSRCLPSDHQSVVRGMLKSAAEQEEGVVC